MSSVFDVCVDVGEDGVDCGGVLGSGRGWCRCWREGRCLWPMCEARDFTPLGRKAQPSKGQRVGAFTIVRDGESSDKEGRVCG